MYNAHSELNMIFSSLNQPMLEPCRPYSGIAKAFRKMGINVNDDDFDLIDSLTVEAPKPIN